MSGQEGVVIASEKICDGIPFKFTGDFITAGGATPFRQEAPNPVNEAKFRYGEILESFMVEAEEVEQQKNQYIILLPGGFKPPTGGHYSMIKYYEEKPEILKVYVITGHKKREEKAEDGTVYRFTYEQSRKIFNAYGGFSSKVEFLESPIEDKGPIKTCFKILEGAGIDGAKRYPEITENFPNAIFSLGAGDKGKDPGRISHFAKYFIDNPNISKVKTAVYAAAPACEVDACPASASRMRAAFMIMNFGTTDGVKYAEALELFKKLLPNEKYYDNVNMILNGQAGQDPSIAFSPEEGEQVNENFFMTDYLFSLVDEVLSENRQPFNKKEGFRIIIEGQEFNKTEFINTYGRDEAMSNLVNGIITYIPDLQKIPEKNRNNEILIPFLDLLADKISNIERSEAAAAEKVAGAVTAEVSTAVGLQGAPVDAKKGGKKMISHEE